MVEQKATAPATKQGVSPQDTAHMTQLEGIRQKVFMDRYSLKDPDGKALEFHPEQLWARVARGIRCSVVKRLPLEPGAERRLSARWAPEEGTLSGTPQW